MKYLLSGVAALLIVGNVFAYQYWPKPPEPVKTEQITKVPLPKEKPPQIKKLKKKVVKKEYSRTRSSGHNDL